MWNSRNCLYRCPGKRWTNGTTSHTSSHCHLCPISADLHALSEEPPKVQLSHLALEAADLASEDHIPVTCFCFPYSSFRLATSTNLHGATRLHRGQFHCWSRLVHESLLYSCIPSCTNSSSANSSAAMWLQQPTKPAGQPNMHNHLQSAITWLNTLNTLART